MSHPFEQDAGLQFSHERLIKQINHCMETLPDSRIGANTHYEMRDAALSAFSTFFLQSPSFLHQQRSMEKKRGISNINTLFGAHKTPSDNQIRNLMDTVPASHFNPVYRRIFTDLNKADYFDSFQVLDQQLLLAFDGTEYFSSTRIQCECCSTAEQKDGSIRYYHNAVTPVIVSPNQSQVIPLAPEFVTPQDGNDKQDCELNASKRWMDQESDVFAEQNITVLGDDLYCHEPFGKDMLSKQWNFILVCKPSSHKTTYEHIDGLSRLGKVPSMEKKQWSGKETLTHHTRYLNDVPLKDGDQALKY